MKHENLIILTPMFGGQCHGAYTRSMLEVKDALGCPVDFLFMYGLPYVDLARNMLLHVALRKPVTHVLFVDADIQFNAADIRLMLDADKEVIAGIYPKKRLNWTAVEFAIKKEFSNIKDFTGDFVVNGVSKVDMDAPFEVTEIGTGFMLIKREVFDKLPVETFKDDFGFEQHIRPGESIKAYFASGVKNGRYLPEDYAFCQLCRENGIPIYVEPRARLGHIGLHNYNGSPFVKGYKKRKPFTLKMD